MFFSGTDLLERLRFPDQEDHYAWVLFLSERPQYADRFKQWDKLGGFNIARILSSHPEFENRVNLKKLKPRAWDELLMHRVEFSNKLSPGDYSQLPRLAFFYKEAHGKK